MAKKKTWKVVGHGRGTVLVTKVTFTGRRTAAWNEPSSCIRWRKVSRKCSEKGFLSKIACSTLFKAIITTMITTANLRMVLVRCIRVRVALLQFHHTAFSLLAPQIPGAHVYAQSGEIRPMSAAESSFLNSRMAHMEEEIASEFSGDGDVDSESVDIVTWISSTSRLQRNNDRRRIDEEGEALASII